MDSTMTYPTLLKGKIDTVPPNDIAAFTTDSNGYIEIRTRPERIQDILHLLYFSANAHKIYNGITPDSSYLDNKKPIELMLDSSLFKGLLKVLNLKFIENKKEAREIIQAIKCLNESQSEQKWKSLLLIGSGFEVLFSLNPAFPAADLRQRLRPLLHLKFSHPVELLWKWVDQFYDLRKAALIGEPYIDKPFKENPDIASSLYHIAKKVLIYAIYDTLFTKHLLEGSSGTPSTPDDFYFIHPEKVLVYFWTKETLNKKITVLKLQANSEEDLKMLNKIKALYNQSQNKI